MARSPKDQAAVQSSNALLASEINAAGGGPTIRVAVRHTDSGHPSSAVFHYGPAFNDQIADTIAHLRDVAPGDVDLMEEANRTLERALEDYPEEDGWEVFLEAIVPHTDEDDRHVIRRIEED